MSAPILTPEEVREHIQDKVEKNHLLDGVEFENTQVSLAIQFAIDRFNSIIPLSGATIYTFPSKGVLLYGTLAVLYEGQAALLARNHMNYTDGGITIPVEERMQLYQSLAAMYMTQFDTSARAIKAQRNSEDGWGGVGSDYSWMPLW